MSLSPFKKAGLTIGALALISAVGFGTAFGYGGSGGHSNSDSSDTSGTTSVTYTSAELETQIATLLNQLRLLQAQLIGGVPFGRDLTINSRGDDVRKLQIYLNTHGFSVALAGPGSLGNETDFFGPLTRAALARFQASVGIAPAVGYFGPITRGYVNAHP